MPIKVAVNKTYHQLLTDQSRVVCVLGGGGSGKSYAIAQKIVLRILSESPHKILVLRKVAATLKESVFALIKDVIIEMGLMHEFEINKTDKSFLHIITQNQILCKGLDEPEKIKSIQGVTSMWLEEATEFDEVDFIQLLLRVRGQHKHYVQYILSFNPISEYHWLKRMIEKDKTVSVLRTTYKDNSYLTAEYIEQLEKLKDLNPIYYQVYCLGEWGVEDKSGKFAYEFNRSKHVMKNVPFDVEETLYISFDFNVNPITCIVAQLHDDVIRVLRVIKLSNSNIYDLCAVINSSYPHSILMVTGDATGRNTSALVKDKLNYYRVIQEQLNLSEGQFVLPSVNPPIEQNRVLVNAVLRNGIVQIDEEHAEPLIFDLTYAEVDERNKLKKDNRTDAKQQLDGLDAFRYLLNSFCKHYLRMPKELVQKISSDELNEID